MHGHTNERTKSTHSPDTASAPNVPFVCFIHDHREGEERRGGEEKREGMTALWTGSERKKCDTILPSSLSLSLSLSLSGDFAVMFVQERE